jgi:microcystin-dependent protein
MATPFLGEVRIFTYSFAPKGWAVCNGQLLPISQNQALFALLGTMYGGNGQNNFALPNLQGRAPVHVGQGFIQGQAGGEVTHTLTAAEMPAHTHNVPASTEVPPDANTVAAASVVATAPLNLYAPFVAGNAVAMNPSVIGTAGGGQAHQNLQPFLTLMFCIALVGVFPSRN